MGMASVAGTGNLRVLTPEEAREQGRRGGIASAKARREKRSMNEALTMIISLPMGKGKVIDLSKIKSIDDLKTANLTLKDKMLTNLALRSLTSDLSFTLLRDQIGEHPIDAETMRSSAIDNLATALTGTTEEDGEDNIDEVPS